MQALKVYCSVKDCRYPYYHITAGHKCGSCGNFGHGRIECSFPKALPKQYWCDIQNCKNPHTHMNKSHHCSECGELHSEVMCDKLKYKLLEKKALDIFKKEDGKIYCILMIGMGCTMYIKRDNIKSKPDFFFMHSDNWGQYGPGTDDRPKLAKFLEGYKEIKDKIENQ